MATVPTTQLDLRLQTLTTFLTLAPTTSASYPHRRTKSSSSSTSFSSVTQSAPAQDAVATSVTIPEVAAVDEVVNPTLAIQTPVGAELELKLRRSSSLSSEGSSGSARKLRFLRLGPVHHGEHLEGDGDWSEEVAVVE